MSKAKSIALYKKWVAEDSNFQLKDDKLFCSMCLKMYDFKRKCEFLQHKSTSLHQSHVARAAKVGSGRQQLLSQVKNEPDETANNFHKKLVMNFLGEGIPLEKLENGPFRDFLEEGFKTTLPSVSTLRRIVVDLAEENVAEIRRHIGESKIWLSVNEAPDPLGHNSANVMVGRLSEEPDKGRLLYVARLDRTNAETIVRAVQEALHILWEGALNAVERVRLMVTDSVDHMLSAGKTLKELFPKLIHVTCLAQALNRVAEAVREEHQLANKLISLGKEIFVKAPTRIEKFRDVLPGVPLPPEPVMTRSGTWIDAASYYFEHFEGFKKVVAEIEDDCEAVRAAKELLQDPNLERQLLFVVANFKKIPQKIERLQEEGRPLVDSVKDVEALVAERWPPKADKQKEKLKAALDQNCGWRDLQAIAQTLEGEEGDLPAGWSIMDVIFMKHAPTTLADVDRSLPKSICSSTAF